jgi:hypothetical protein
MSYGGRSSNENGVASFCATASEFPQPSIPTRTLALTDHSPGAETNYRVPSDGSNLLRLIGDLFGYGGRTLYDDWMGRAPRLLKTRTREIWTKSVL